MFSAVDRVLAQNVSYQLHYYLKLEGGVFAIKVEAHTNLVLVRGHQKLSQRQIQYTALRQVPVLAEFIL